MESHPRRFSQERGAPFKPGSDKLPEWPNGNLKLHSLNLRAVEGLYGSSLTDVAPLAAKPVREARVALAGDNDFSLQSTIAATQQQSPKSRATRASGYPDELSEVVDNRGGPGVIRTPDLRFRKPLLYPAELRGQSGCNNRT
jgi:hypothetical protein